MLNRRSASSSSRTGVCCLAFCAVLFGVMLPVAGAGAQTSGGGKVAAKGAFFESLYDIPVMPGLEEFHDQAVLFDKPDGRIASVVAGAPNLAPAAVQAFYDDTLTQMGWKKMLKNQYVRGEDRLEMSVERRPALTVVRFTLSPAR